MILLSVFTVLLFSVAVLGDLSNPPPFAPCNTNDVPCVTKLIQWVYTSTIAGDPNLGIESFDPVYKDLIEGKLPNGKYSMKKNNMEGFKTCEVNHASFNENFTSTHIDFTCHRFHMDGLYSIDGSILTLPIRGNGDYYFDATEYRVILDTEMKLIKKDGEIYVVYKNVKFEAELNGDLDFDLLNLFDGRKDLSGPIFKFANKNKKFFSSLFHNSIIGPNIKRLLKNINKNLKSVPTVRLVQIDVPKYELIQGHKIE